jgi:hypothetical protein
VAAAHQKGPGQVERTLASDWTSSANVDSALRHLIDAHGYFGHALLALFYGTKNYIPRLLVRYLLYTMECA